MGVVCVLALGVWLTPAPATAASFMVRAHTEAQFYELRAWRETWADEVTVPRQRLLQSLSLYGNDLVERQDLDVDLTLRLGTDLGWRTAEPEALDGASRHTADLLTFTVRWRSHDGSIQAAAGRLMKLDALSWRYIDGAEASWHHRWFFVSAYAGIMVKDGWLLGSPTFELDGVRSSDAEALAREAFTGTTTDDHALTTPTFGAEVGTGDSLGVRARLGYHHAMSGGAVDLQRATARAGWRHRGVELTGVAEYDLLFGRISQADLAAGWHLDQDQLYVGLQAGHVHPSFDGDSIWNFFVAGPRQELTATARWRLTEAFAVSARLGPHLYLDGGDLAASQVLAGELHATWQVRRRTRFMAMTSYADGWGGTQVWGQLAGQHHFLPRLSGTLQLAAGHVNDPELPDLRSMVMGARAGVSWHFDESARVTFLLEDNTSRFLTHDVRATALIDLGLAF